MIGLLIYQDLSHPCPVGAGLGFTGHELHVDGTCKCPGTEVTENRPVSLDFTGKKIHWKLVDNFTICWRNTNYQGLTM